MRTENMQIKSNELNNFFKKTSLNDLTSGHTFLIYDVHLGKENPDKNYQNALKAIEQILSTSKSDWPTDSEWRDKFSESFNKHFPDLSREECGQMLRSTTQTNWNELPWDFGSWLDVLKRRTWTWAGHQRKSNFLQIALDVNDPNAGDLEAFDEIFNACGAKIVRHEVVKI